MSLAPARIEAVPHPEARSAYPPIEDYAAIGNCRTAGLISREGSLDWLCLPHFHSPSVFGALLDADRGGRFLIRPAEPFETSRRYRGHSHVLETTFETARGAVRLTDAMPVTSEEEKLRRMWPPHEVARMVEGLAGEVELEVFYQPRPDYGRAEVPLRDRGALGLACQHHARLLLLRTDVPLKLADGDTVAIARFRLRAGERRSFDLTFNDQEPAVLAPLGDDLADRISQSADWWQRWADRCRYEGRHRDAVVRSLLTLKLMTFAPSGAVIAAPTTSLPEEIGGLRNWDYRFCWIRDASFTLRALMALGYEREGVAFLSWLLHSTRRTAPRLQTLYDVFGEHKLRERELKNLEGYAGSRPVRIGNAAEKQLQLDSYGEVIDAAHEFARRGGHFDRSTARLLVGFGKQVCKLWRLPDNGIWEVRRDRRHHTHSKVMCWVALERLLSLHRHGFLRAPVERFRREAAAIRAEVESHGYNRKLGSYVATFGGGSLDAALLLLPRYGYTDYRAPRMRGTVRRAGEELLDAGLVRRYASLDDGLPGQEGAFGICSFWYASSLAHQDPQSGYDMFADLCSRANDVGLYAEEIAPQTGAHLGNFPQAFTHVGLVDAALDLVACTGEGRVRREPRQEVRT